MKHETSQFLPLSPASLHILLALAGEDLHGYGIMQEIARQSAGQYKLGPGTLYDNLKKLMLLGLIEETSSRSSTDDPRRRYYRLKGLGRNVRHSTRTPSTDKSGPVERESCLKSSIRRTSILR
jgi:DNA-binding PadR family transcriptional regulator